MRIAAHLLFLLALAGYLVLTLYQVELPGPNYDEAVEAKAAVQLLSGQPVEAHRDAVLRLGGLRLPLMVVDYVGALNTYVLLLVFKVGGISVAAMRLWPIVVGAGILLLTFLLAQELFGRRAAALAAVLLAVQPSFIFFSRQGIYVTNTTIAFSLAILLALWHWARTGHPRWLILSAFLAGLGLWAKFIMLWPLLATAMLAPLTWIGRRRLGLQPAAGFSPQQALRPRAGLGALAAFLLGLSPFILFNLQTGATFAHFLGTLGQSYYGIENTDYLGNLAVRWGQMKAFVDGSHFWYLGGNFADALAGPALVFGLALVLAYGVWYVARGGKDGDQEVQLFPKVELLVRALFLYAFLALLFLQTPLTPTALWYTHLAMFSPFLALATAAGWELLFRLLPRRPASVLAILFVALLAASGVGADVHYHRALAASGGYADHSDASYRLAATLLEAGVTRPYALDWGFDAPLILLSDGEVNPIEIFGYEPFDAPDPGFPSRVLPLLQDPATVFLLHAPDRTNFPGRREALIAVAAAAGIPLESVAVVHERSGAPHTELLRPAR